MRKAACPPRGLTAICGPRPSAGSRRRRLRAPGARPTPTRFVLMTVEDYARRPAVSPVAGPEALPGSAVARLRAVTDEHPEAGHEVAGGLSGSLDEVIEGGGRECLASPPRARCRPRLRDLSTYLWPSAAADRPTTVPARNAPAHDNGPRHADVLAAAFGPGFSLRADIWTSRLEGLLRVRSSHAECSAVRQADRRRQLGVCRSAS